MPEQQRQQARQQPQQQPDTTAAVQQQQQQPQQQRKQHHELQMQHQQQKAWRIQQQLANYRPQRRPRRQPPMVPSPSFVAGVVLASAGCMLLMGGAICFVKRCGGSADIGISLLALSAIAIAIGVALFASLPCCYCDESRNCHLRDACAERCDDMRQAGGPCWCCCCCCRRSRNRRRIGSIASAGLPAITVKDYSSSASTMGQPPPALPSDGCETGGSGRRASIGAAAPAAAAAAAASVQPHQLAWCYDGEPPDPNRLHPMYGRRDSWISGPVWEALAPARRS